MATVTGMTAERMKQIEASSVVNGAVDLNGRLQLTTHGGDTIDAGNVKGPVGGVGPEGVGPTGSIIMFSSDNIPQGWLVCDGAAISRITYSVLFGVLGTSFGVGNGSTTFNLPNLKERVGVGQNPQGTSDFNSIGRSGGAKEVTLTVAMMPSHTHTQNSHTHTQNSHTHTQNSHTHTGTASSAGGHTHGVGGSGYRFAASDRSGDWGLRAPGGTYSSGVRGLAIGASDMVTSIASTNTDGAHTHSVTTAGTTAANNAATATNNVATATNNAATATNQNTTAINNNAGGNGAHTNMQPYLILNYIIKV